VAKEEPLKTLQETLQIPATNPARKYRLLRYVLSMHGAHSHLGRLWKLRRVAAGLRQIDVARNVGITPTRLSQLERGEVEPSPLDVRLLERELPVFGELKGLPVPCAGESRVESARCRSAAPKRDRKV